MKDTYNSKGSLVYMIVNGIYSEMKIADERERLKLLT